MRDSGFVQSFVTDPPRFVWHATDGGGSLVVSGPSADEIDAFVLNIRFFLQKSEHSSFRWLADHALADPGVSLAWKNAFAQARDALNMFLQDQPGIRIRRGCAAPLTNQQILDLFVYGDLAHATSDPSKRVSFIEWMLVPLNRGLLTTQVLSILYAIFLLVRQVALQTEQELQGSA